MGLDGVEIVMEVEDEFRISIPDKDSEHILTVGGLAHYVEHRLYGTRSSLAEPGCGTSRVFYAVRRTLMNALGVDRAAVRPHAELAALVPYFKRRSVWEQMEQAGLGAPALRVPDSVHAGVIAFAGVVGIALAYWHAILLIAFIPIACGIAMCVTRSMNAFLPPECVTVGDLARRTWLVNSEPERHYDVFDRVTTIVAEQMGIPKQSLRPETRFQDILD